jgi:uncharacterized protein YqfA (UPF0365 family)
MVPLAFNDIYDTMVEQGVAKGTALTLLSILGYGIQTYDKNRRNAKTAIEKIKARIKIYNRRHKEKQEKETANAP